MSINNSFTLLDDVITAVKSGHLKSTGTDPHNFNVYWIDKDVESVSLNDEVYVGEASVVDEDVSDEDYDFALLPEPVKARNGALLFSGEVIEDVIQNTIQQIDMTDNSTLFQAIYYYWRYDCFYNFTQPESNIGNLN